MSEFWQNLLWLIHSTQKWSHKWDHYLEVKSCLSLLEPSNRKDKLLGAEVSNPPKPRDVLELMSGIQNWGNRGTEMRESLLK